MKKLDAHERSSSQNLENTANSISNQNVTVKEALLWFLTEFCGQLLIGLLFTSVIGLFIWVGIWSLVLIVPSVLAIYYVLTTRNVLNKS